MTNTNTRVVTVIESMTFGSQYYVVVAGSTTDVIGIGDKTDITETGNTAETLG